MSSLPNPNDFKDFTAILSKNIKFDDTEKKYDLEKIHFAMKKNVIPSGYISKLLDVEILKYSDITQDVLKNCILYDKMNDSIAIALKEDEKIMAIVIQKSFDEDEEIIRWKTLGSKKYIPYKIRDNTKVVFIFIGMKEFLLMELLELNYIVPQSDSIVKGLDSNKQWIEDIKPLIQDKLIIYVNENDKSSRELIEPLKTELKGHSKLLNIDINSLYLFYIITNGGSVQDLKIGFDFIDLCNLFKDMESIEITLKEFIEMELNNE